MLAGVDVTLVEVRCAPAELARREVARGDRPVGLAVSQTLVYGHGDRDIVVDTTHCSAQECAREIVAVWAGLAGPKAFDRLRQR